MLPVVVDTLNYNEDTVTDHDSSHFVGLIMFETIWTWPGYASWIFRSRKPNARCIVASSVIKQLTPVVLLFHGHLEMGWLLSSHINRSHPHRHGDLTEFM